MRNERLGHWVLFVSTFSLATSRWGSWLGIPGTSFFFIDICLVGLFLFSLSTRFPPRDLLIFLILTSYVFFEVIRSSEYGIFVRLRDLAPFLYLMIFVKLRIHIQSLGTLIVMKYLRIGSLTSLTWSLASSIGVIGEFSIGRFTGVPIFSLRADQFGFVAAIGIIAWAQLNANGIWKRFLKILVITLFLLEVSLLPGRAGAIASIVGVFYLILSTSTKSRQNRHIGIFLLVAITSLFAASTVLQTFLPDDSSIKRSGLVSGSETAEASGTGTASARLIAQKRLIDWIDQNDLEIFGAGPGREMLIESGAYRWLSGSVDVRQPHNWWVSVYARFGLLGTLLWFFLTIILWKPFKGKIFSVKKNYFLLSILVSSSFSVILEAPFGLIPFYFLLMTTEDNTTKNKPL